MIAAAWANLTFTLDPIADSLRESAEDAIEVRTAGACEPRRYLCVELLNSLATRGWTPGGDSVTDPHASAAVSIEGVSKTYGDGHSRVQALHNVSLAIRPGEFVCLLGASGCGKSTLLNLIAGSYHLDQGVIETGGRRVGFVFQEPALFPWLTVARNVEAGMRFRNVPKINGRERVAELLATRPSR